MKKLFFALTIVCQSYSLEAQTNLEVRNINKVKIILPTFKNLLSLSIAKPDGLKEIMKANDYLNLSRENDTTFYPRSNDKVTKVKFDYSISKDKSNNLLVMTFQENGPQLISEFRTELKTKYPSAKTQIDGSEEQYVINLDGKFNVIFFIKDLSKIDKSSNVASVGIMF